MELMQTQNQSLCEFELAEPSATADVPSGDVELFDLLADERRRQAETIDLVAASGRMTDEVLRCARSEIGNLSAEGYPSARFHPGCEVGDRIEELAVERAKAAFGAQYANVQPHSGTSANFAVLEALLRPGDALLAMDLKSGGHLSHGANASSTGTHFDAYHYGISDSGWIDMDGVAALARQVSPRLIICGASSYPREIDFANFREIADAVGAFLLADISHIAGQVVAGKHQSPIDLAHFTTCSTYKQLGGPRGGLILMGVEANTRDRWGKTLSSQVQRAVFPKCQGTPSFAAIAGKAAALLQVQKRAFREHICRSLTNAQSLAQSLKDCGQELVTLGTDTQMVVMDLSNKGVAGRTAETALEACGILANRNLLANDTRSAQVTSGLRFSTHAVSWRGFGADQVALIAAWISDVIDELSCSGVISSQTINLISDRVRYLCSKFPLKG